MAAVEPASRQTLAGALGVGACQCVALVGGGGKSTALKRIAGDAAAAHRRVVATTTTAMYLDQLSAVGPVVLRVGGGDWVAALDETLSRGRPAAVAHCQSADGKAVGLSTADVDALWASDVADVMVVEADGSRGLSLKAFGPGEPQVPCCAGLVVVVAGLDVVGRPLTDQYVHRASILAADLDVALGVSVTAHLLARSIRAQVARVRAGATTRRCVALLNKADTAEARAAGRAVARDLLGGFATDEDEHGTSDRPDAVVVGSLLRGSLHVEGRS